MPVCLQRLAVGRRPHARSGAQPCAYRSGVVPFPRSSTPEIFHAPRTACSSSALPQAKRQFRSSSLSCVQIERLVNGMEKYGTHWAQVQQVVGTRTQVRTRLHSGTESLAPQLCSVRRSHAQSQICTKVAYRKVAQLAVVRRPQPPRALVHRDWW